jgi:hypothetical protein
MCQLHTRVDAIGHELNGAPVLDDGLAQLMALHVAVPTRNRLIRTEVRIAVAASEHRDRDRQDE